MVGNCAADKQAGACKCDGFATSGDVDADAGTINNTEAAAEPLSEDDMMRRVMRRVAALAPNLRRTDCALTVELPRQYRQHDAAAALAHSDSACIYRTTLSSRHSAAVSFQLSTVGRQCAPALSGSLGPARAGTDPDCLCCRHLP